MSGPSASPADQGHTSQNVQRCTACAGAGCGSANDHGWPGGGCDCQLDRQGPVKGQTVQNFSEMVNASATFALCSCIIASHSLPSNAIVSAPARRTEKGERTTD